MRHWLHGCIAVMLLVCTTMDTFLPTSTSRPQLLDLPPPPGCAVARMHGQLMEWGDPQPQHEGFASVLVAESDAEVAAALEAWAGFRRRHADPAAEYARLKPAPPIKPSTALDRWLTGTGGKPGGGGKPAGSAVASQALPPVAAGKAQQRPAASVAGVGDSSRATSSSSASKHTFPSAGPATISLVSIAANPER